VVTAKLGSNTPSQNGRRAAQTASPSKHGVHRGYRTGTEEVCCQHFLTSGTNTTLSLHSRTDPCKSSKHQLAQLTKQHPENPPSFLSSPAILQLLQAVVSSKLLTMTPRHADTVCMAGQHIQCTPTAFSSSSNPQMNQPVISDKPRWAGSWYAPACPAPSVVPTSVLHALAAQNPSFSVAHPLSQ
jgi:hypothetical protein